MKEKMKIEALNRLEQLCDELGLNPKVYNYFDEGKLYYSYLTAGGLIGSIDRIDYDKRYAKAVKAIENETGAMIYHVIETQIQNTTILSFLCVTKYTEDWEMEHLDDNMIDAFVCLPESPLDYEYGTIVLSSKQGALIRIG